MRHCPASLVDSYLIILVAKLFISKKSSMLVVGVVIGHVLYPDSGFSV